MKLLISLSLIFASTLSFYGQQSIPTEGTYQLLIHNTGKKEIVFTSDFIQNLNIETLRKNDSDTTVIINSTVSVFIPSRQKIESAEFVKLEQKKYE